MMESCSSNTHKTLVLSNAIKVMVIDHKKDFLSAMGDFLKSHSFEVTCVDQVAAALKMLMEKKENFDLLLIDSDMRDVDTITFLRLTRNMDALSIVMCQEIDDHFLLEVLENGGFRLLKTPLTDEMVMQARQDVLRERVYKYDESETPESAIKKNVKTCYPIGIPNSQMLESVGVKEKKFVRWTKEIHSIFLRALDELGEGNCFPKNILEAMGAPGLTRMQVASHLQKYRQDVSKTLKRKGIPSSSKNKISTSNVSHEGYLTMFGNIPSVATHVENYGQIVTDIANTFPSNGGQWDVNNQSITDASLMNGFGFGNLGEVYSVPTDFNGNHFPPNQVCDDFFDIQNGNNQNPSMACMELNVWGPNSNQISEQILPNHYQVMSYGTSDFNQHI